MSTLILPAIANALSPNFVKWEKLAEVMSLGYAMQKPVLLYGRGGHGKSEMVRSVFKALAETSKDIFIQSCGEGMTEAKLFGGLSLKALNCPDNPRMQFNPEESFLARRFALLEELFDAPPVVLLSLKDTLMDKCLNNGHQQFQMQTELLVAATNKHPGEISELGDSAHALTERFPLQLSVEWDSYGASDFEELYDKVPRKGPVILGSSIKGLLAHMIAEAHEKGEWISPRQAVVCLDVVAAAAQIAGRREAIEDDLLAIQFIPGTSEVLNGMNENIARLKAVAEATNRLTAIQSKVESLEAEMLRANSPAKVLVPVKQLMELESEVGNLRVPDALTKDRNALGEQIGKLIQFGTKRSIEVTIVPR